MKNIIREIEVKGGKYENQKGHLIDLMPKTTGRLGYVAIVALEDGTLGYLYLDEIIIKTPTPKDLCKWEGHIMYKVTEIDNGRSKLGEHKCSRCGHQEPFQFDYGV